MQSADWVSAEFACASYRQLKLASLGQVLNKKNGGKNFRHKYLSAYLALLNGDHQGL